MSDDALIERIARAIYGAQEHTFFPTDLDEAPKWLRESVLTDAAAVLPILRAAQADALRAWATGVESELDASRAHGIDLGEWERGLRSGVRQALQTADRIETED